MLVTQSCPTLLTPWTTSKPTSLLSPRDFPDKSTGVGCHFLLQGIFPTQGSKPGLPHCGQILSPLTHYVYLPTKGISQFWMHLLPLNPCFPWFSSTAPMSGGCFAVLTGGIFFSLWSFPPFGELNVCCLNSGKVDSAERGVFSWLWETERRTPVGRQHGRLARVDVTSG